jgi:hypothetical protein
MRATFTALLILLALILLIIFGEVQVTELLLSSPCHFVLLSTLFLHSLCSSLIVRDQVPHPYKAAGKIIVV